MMARRVVVVGIVGFVCWTAASCGNEDDSGPCTGVLADVAPAFGVECPLAFCEAEMKVRSCELFGGVATRYTHVFVYNSLNALYFEWGTHTKTCVYEWDVLVGAAATDQDPTFCGHRARSIRSGTFVDPEGNSQATTSGVCVEDAVDDSGADPPLCFNSFFGDCGPCCPDPMQDCTGQPDGYPGYSCTQSPGSYCTCECRDEQWSCGC